MKMLNRGLLGFFVPMFALAQTLEIKTDRENAVYSCGDTAVFTVKAEGKDRKPLTAGKLKLLLTNFGTNTLVNQSFDLSKQNPVTVKGTLARPGFLKCEASMTTGTNHLRKVYGAAVSPLEIKNPVPRPADFDAFWDGAVKKLEAEVPMDAKMELLKKYTNAKHDAYLVSFATFNKQRVYGFLTVPKGKKGPFPVTVNVPGAGLGSYTPSTGVADQGYIALVMCVHTFKPGNSTEEQSKLYQAQDKRLHEQWHVARYCHSGATSRETYFYYPVILGINRAVDWLAARPDADKTRFFYQGTSQGGGFGFYLAGLNKHFTKGVSYVPALTGLLDFKAGRQSGWPRLVEAQEEADKAAAEKIAPYFDAGNFAARITCPYRVAVGFSDETCAPAAVYSGYNQLRVKDKAIVHGLGMGHSVYRWVYQKLTDGWLYQ